MMNIKVDYLLDDYAESQLKALSAAYKEQGLDVSLESLFTSIMRTGSIYDIAEKLAYHEWKVGIRQELPSNDEVFKETKARLEERKE